MPYFFLICLLITRFLSAECWGRVDVGPAYVKVDMLESGKTVRSLDLAAIKGEGSALLFCGLCLKPSLLLASGKGTTLNSGSLGLGVCIPLPLKISVTPCVGLTETQFRSRIDLPQYGLFKQKEKFRSQGQYIGCEVAWTFVKGWRLYGLAQMCWSRVHWRVGEFLHTKQHCKGPNYAVALEHDLCDYLSVSLGAGYNSSLSKEKHGLRGKGVKLGLALWF